MMNAQKTQDLNWNIQYNKNTAYLLKKTPKPKATGSHILNQLK